MNLHYVYQLLAAADEQRHGFLKLRGAQADHEVHLMAEAGLVTASFGEGEGGPFSCINRVSAEGKTFLRAFKDHPIPETPAEYESMQASQPALMAKWKSHFAPGVLSAPA